MTNLFSLSLETKEIKYSQNLSFTSLANPGQGTYVNTIAATCLPISSFIIITFINMLYIKDHINLLHGNHYPDTPNTKSCLHYSFLLSTQLMHLSFLFPVQNIHQLSSLMSQQLPLMLSHNTNIQTSYPSFFSVSVVPVCRVTIWVITQQGQRVHLALFYTNVEVFISEIFTQTLRNQTKQNNS